MNTLRPILIGIFLASIQAAATAGTASATLTVGATLTNPGSNPSQGCVSQAFSNSSNAIVKVVCGTSQVLSIEPMPGRPILGTNGAAFRFALSAGLAAPAPTSVVSTNASNVNNSSGNGNSDGAGDSGNNSADRNAGGRLVLVNPYVGSGTVTSSRVINLTGTTDLFEFLVSF